MSLVLWLFGIPLVVLALVWMGQRRLIYFPSRDVPAPATVGLEHVELVTFDTSDGLMLHGWFLPSARPARFTVLVFNGNAGNRAHRAEFGAALRAQGLAVFLFDYRGFGENGARPPKADSRRMLAPPARISRPGPTSIAAVSCTSGNRWERRWPWDWPPSTSPRL